MNILQSCLSESWGGMEMLALDTAYSLSRAGIKTTMICLNNTRLCEEVKKKDIPFKTINGFSYFNPFKTLSFSLFLKQNKFDIIHTHFSKDLWLLVPSLKMQNSSVPLILTKHVGSFIQKNDILHRFLYNRLTKVIAISKVIERNLLDTCPLQPSKISLIYNPIDTAKFDKNTADRNKIRNEFSIEADTVLIGMSARFTPGKGHEEFIDAAFHLIRKFRDVKFLIAGEASRGESEYADKIKNIVLGSCYKDKFIFTGFRQDIPDVLAALDIFCFPSHAEAFGLALAEAMSMGLACIGSDTDAVPELITDCSNGLLFRMGNVSDFVSKIEDLLINESLRNRLGKSAALTIRNSFDKSIYLEKLTSLYKNPV